MFSNIGLLAGDNQSLKSWRRDRESNPRSLALQAKCLTTTPPLLPLHFVLLSLPIFSNHVVVKRYPFHSRTSLFLIMSVMAMFCRISISAVSCVLNIRKLPLKFVLQKLSAVSMFILELPLTFKSVNVLVTFIDSTASVSVKRLLVL